MKNLVVSLLVTFAVAVSAQEFKKRQVANYKEVEIMAPLTIYVVNEHDIVTLYTKTKHLTTVHLPLAAGDLISFIGTGDDEQLWQVHGVETKNFTVKPADLAHQTTALVRTHSGLSFHFRLVNLAVPDAYMSQFSTVEEQEAFGKFQNEMAAYDPYVNVILKYRDNRLEMEQTNLIQRRQKELEREIAAYRQLNEQLLAKEAELEASFFQREEQRTEAYAALVEYDDYEIDYRNRRVKKRWPVQKVFNDSTFTWVQVAEAAPAFHIYEVRDKGFEVVNAHMVSDGLYRIDRVCDRLEFRDGPKGDWVYRVSLN